MSEWIFNPIYLIWITNLWRFSLTQVIVIQRLSDMLFVLPWVTYYLRWCATHSKAKGFNDLETITPGRKLHLVHVIYHIESWWENAVFVSENAECCNGFQVATRDLQAQLEKTWFLSICGRQLAADGINFTKTLMFMAASCLKTPLSQLCCADSRTITESGDSFNLGRHSSFLLQSFQILFILSADHLHGLLAPTSCYLSVHTFL